MGASNILQEALLRAAHQQTSLGSPTTTQNPENDDSVITRVHSPATSPPFSPRSSSPTPTSSSKSKSRNQSRVGLRKKIQAAMLAKQNSSDPLLRFPIDVAVRIFTIVGLGADGCGGQYDGLTFSAVKDLLNCGLVCQKWRSSSVISYIWFKLFHQISYSKSVEEEFQPLTWTRKDSRTDWCARFKEVNQVKAPAGLASILDIDEETGPTSKELKEAEWQAQVDRSSTSKTEARAFYKELGGRKLRDKTGKGWGADRTGWHDLEV